MTLKISGILIPLLCFASESRNENIKDNLFTTVITPPHKTLLTTKNDHKRLSQKILSTSCKIFIILIQFLMTLILEGFSTNNLINKNNKNFNLN